MEKNQINEYKDRGFFLVKGLIPIDECNEVLADIHSIVRFQLKRFMPSLSNEKLGEHNVLANEMELLLQFDVKAYLAFARRSAKLVKLHRYLSHENIISLLNDLDFELPTIVTEPVLHINSDKLMIPNGYAGFDTHQDWPSIQGSLDCVVLWAPLVNISLRNFPLQVIPKSHKKGLYQGEVRDNILKIDPELYDTSKYEAIEANAGDIVLMSSWTLHKTGINDCKGFRLACSTRYDNSAEQTFIERNYPCAYQRKINRQMITPNFPSVKQVSNQFDK